MRQYPLLIFLVVLLFDEGFWGKLRSTYETIVDRFSIKAKASNPATNIDWKEKLLPLFTLQVAENVLDETLQPQNISHISTPVLKVFDAVDQESIVIHSVADFRGILRNQHSVNKLGDEIRAIFANDSIASMSIFADLEFRSREKTALTKSHVKMVERNLERMQTQYNDFSEKIMNVLNQVKSAKELFTKATTSLVDRFTNIENPNKNLSILGGIISSYRGAQTLVWDHLKMVKDLLVTEYNKLRKLWIEFLLAIRLALDTNPQQLQHNDRKSKSLPTGTSSGLMGKQLNKLTKVLRRSRS